MIFFYVIMGVFWAGLSVLYYIDGEHTHSLVQMVIALIFIVLAYLHLILESK